jgi:hypothetical protein
MKKIKRKNVLLNTVFAAICMAFVFACKTDIKSNIEFTPLTVADSSHNYSNDTAINNIISIKYFEAKSEENGNSVANIINGDFFAWISPFFDIDSEQITKNNLKNVVASSIKTFIKDINEDKLLVDCVSCKHAELLVEPRQAYQNDRIVSLVYSFSQYSGGAHGNYGIATFNYKKDGTPLTVENLSTNIDELAKIAEQAFIKQNGELAKFQFDGGKFYLPDVFYFTEKSVKFYYSLYEIAPYAAGDIYVELDNDEVKHLIDYIN